MNIKRKKWMLPYFCLTSLARLETTVNFYRRPMIDITSFSSAGKKQKHDYQSIIQVHAFGCVIINTVTFMLKHEPET